MTSRDSNRVLRFDESDGSLSANSSPNSAAGWSPRSDCVSVPTAIFTYRAAGTNQVLRYNGTSGAFIDVFATTPVDSQPADLRFGPDGNLYVALFGGS
ncbi:MAG: hypothetical protein R3C10_16230 [Pirellulales bacterium]